jgi:branched-chain amino acid transport system ATP-binding protein
VFPALTVRRNLELGAWTRRQGTRAALERVFGYFPRLEERAGQLAGTLSGGEQQMLAIGRALMAQPRVLLVDEASLGLSPLLAETVFRIVREINADGTTVLVVEQNVGILPYVDQALVMEKGSLTYVGSSSQLERSGDLRRTYLG